MGKMELHEQDGLVAQFGAERIPFPRTELFHSHYERYAKRGVAFQHGDTNLEFGDLAIEVARHEGLAKQLDTVHLCFDTDLPVVSAPSSPDGATQILAGAEGTEVQYQPVQTDQPKKALRESCSLPQRHAGQHLHRQAGLNLCTAEAWLPP